MSKVSFFPNLDTDEKKERANQLAQEQKRAETTLQRVIQQNSSDIFSALKYALKESRKKDLCLCEDDEDAFEWEHPDGHIVECDLAEYIKHTLDDVRMAQDRLQKFVATGQE